MPLEPGTQAPDFGLLSHTRKPVRLGDLKGARSMIVFMPFPFTSTCTSEACTIRDDHERISDAGARVVMITTHAVATNAEWARQLGLEYDILSDYWPHGKVSQAYDAFDERAGYSTRVTYFLDEDGVISDVVASPNLGDPRDHLGYAGILGKY